MQETLRQLTGGKKPPKGPRALIRGPRASTACWGVCRNQTADHRSFICGPQVAITEKLVDFVSNGRPDELYVVAVAFLLRSSSAFIICRPCGPFKLEILVVASIFFYGYGQPELLPLLASAVLGTYLFLALTLRDRRFWLPIGIAFNLLLLAFFKYKFLFFTPPAVTGNGAIDFLVNLPLPIGISFFSYSTTSVFWSI